MYDKTIVPSKQSLKHDNFKICRTSFVISEGILIISEGILMNLPVASHLLLIPEITAFYLMLEYFDCCELLYLEIFIFNEIKQSS